MPTDLAADLRSLTFALAVRAFARHVHEARRPAVDIRWLRDVLALAEGAAPTDEAGVGLVTGLRDELRAIERARTVSSEARRVTARASLARIDLVRRHVLAPQAQVTRRPALLALLAAGAADVRDTLGMLAPSTAEDEALVARARELARTCERRREGVLESRTRLDQQAFVDALQSEHRSAISSVRAAYEDDDDVRTRLCLDRAFEAWRQLAEAADAARAVASGRRLLRVTRRFGPGAGVAAD